MYIFDIFIFCFEILTYIPISHCYYNVTSQKFVDFRAPQHLGLHYCPGHVNIFKIAEVQIKIRVCLPYMAGIKISSCNYRDTKTWGCH